MRVLDRFRQPELERIRAAVAEAEIATSGEIVTYIVGECDSYPEVAWRGASLGALAGLGVGVGLHWWGTAWVSPLWWLLLPVVVGMLSGGLAAARISWLRRRLIAGELLAHRVSQRAESAFLEEEVFSTNERTGILIFVALFEHRVVVLGDSGINSVVEPTEWQEIIDHMVEELGHGRPAEALVRGVADCGRLLERRGVEIRPDDRDELANAPRLRDR